MTDNNGKCEICGSCGYIGCCNPNDYCTMQGNNIHCKRYLNELRFSYYFYSETYRLLYNNQNKYPELFKEIEKIIELGKDIFIDETI